MSEQTVDFGINGVDDFTEVFLVFREAVVIDVNDEQFTFVVGRNPGFVALVEALEVVEADAFFVVAAALLDLRYQSWYTCAQVNEKIWRGDKGIHEIEQREIVFEVAGGHETHRVKVGRKNEGIFVDGAVLDNSMRRFFDFLDLRKAAIEVIDLQVERPTLHVVVEIVEIGVLIHVFKMGVPVVMFGEQVG